MVVRHVIEISLTEKCNNKCVYCASRRRDATSYSIPKEEMEIKGENDKLKEIGVESLKKWLRFQQNTLGDIRIVITGGEPTTHGEWLSLLEWIADNGFKKPLLYTNGFNLKDLFATCRARDLCKVILTHHGDKEQTRLYVQMLKELQMEFILKILVGENSDIDDLRMFGESLHCWTKYEGIRKLPNDKEQAAKEIASKNVLGGESPYHWRWNGYGNKIDSERTKFAPSVVLSVVPVGEIFCCHHYDRSLSNIDTPKVLENLDMAPCIFVDTFDFNDLSKTETRCEILHYVNLMDVVQ